MNKIANVLKDHGVKKGERVVIYMPVSPIAVASMLACARIGAVHSVVFAGFSADALASRVNDGRACVRHTRIITMLSILFIHFVSSCTSFLNTLQPTQKR